ncbi:ABC transporter substrate-binding protein [Azospirillum sp. SYSU D00513]|uniref:MlaC/ttg2D family ABC transporter substrate-binding protein n=1 Tax=Azospirillum sp. SYSU D00513 TaxID=2812561 RepID=UPI001FFF9B55|nr:ABC transporter substrate-binding protein [Azospirillum sp. SYSU D00513]
MAATLPNMLTRRLFMTCAALLAVSSRVASPAFAQTAGQGAGAFIERLGNQAIATFANKSTPKDQAQARFRELLNEGFDVPYIGRWVLGRYWNQATPQQQEEYLTLFERMVVDTYANRFVEYSGETFKVVNTRSAGEADSMVTTQIVRPSGPPINVDWRVRQRGDSYKIIDVMVEGVSMGVTQRQEFASVIEQNGGRIDGLIRALRQRTARAG